MALAEETQQGRGGVQAAGAGGSPAGVCPATADSESGPQVPGRWYGCPVSRAGSRPFPGGREEAWPCGGVPMALAQQRPEMTAAPTREAACNRAGLITAAPGGGTACEAGQIRRWFMWPRGEVQDGGGGPAAPGSSLRPLRHPSSSPMPAVHRPRACTRLCSESGRGMWTPASGPRSLLAKPHRQPPPAPPSLL